MASAGVVCLANGRALLLRRSDAVDKPGLWAFPGGGIEDGETAEQAALREFSEEVGTAIDSVAPVCAADDFSLFLHKCDPFNPQLNDEHDGYVWAHLDDLPSPLHPGTADMLKQAVDCSMAGDAAPKIDLALAFDKSTRTYDQDGRMRVEVAHISKANVCGYLGSEIPEWQTLGLDPKRLYQLLRDPEELAKAAPTFNGIPILDTHVPSVSWDHPKGRVVGTTGTSSAFNAPYLDNSLVIWTADAINGIETSEQRELSCGYRYRADMTPGDFDGQQYDGVMRDILGNHVALVTDGRAGSDVMVGDAAIPSPRTILKKTEDGFYASVSHLANDSSPSTTNPEKLPMKTKAMSKKAVLAKGALMASVQLAADQKLDLDALLKGVNHANWEASKSAIVAAIEPKLAADADVASVVKLLDSLDDEEQTDAEAEANPNASDEPVYDDEDPVAELMTFLQGKLSDEDIAAVAEKISALKAPVAQAQDEPSMKPGSPDESPSKKDDDMVSKTAMDAAVRLASDSAEKRAVARVNGIREAEEVVQPYVGKLAMSFDSAEGVYKAALETLGVDVKGVHPSAFRSILQAQQKPGEQKQRMASDSALTTGLADRFPGLSQVRKV